MIALSPRMLKSLGIKHDDWRALRDLLMRQHLRGGIAASQCICGMADNGQSPACRALRALVEAAEMVEGVTR